MEKENRDGSRAALVISCYLEFDEFQNGLKFLRKAKGANKKPTQRSSSGSKSKKVSSLFIGNFVLFFVGILAAVVWIYHLHSVSSLTGINGVVYRVLCGYLIGIFVLLIIFGFFSTVTLVRTWCCGKRSFNLKFYNDFLCVEQSDGIKTVVAYTSNSAKMLEYEKFFLVMTSAKNIYVVPKRCIDEEKIETARKYVKKIETSCDEKISKI